MNDNVFKILVTGHERKARSLLRCYLTDEELAQMCSYEVENKINELFFCYLVGDDYMLIRRDKENEFKDLVNWVCR